MRLLLINSGFDSRGAHRGSVELFLHFRELGWDVTYFVPDRPVEHPDGVIGLRVSGERYLRALEWLYRPIEWRHVGSRWKLGNIGVNDYDVVHLHNLHGGWISLVAVQRLARRIPTVWTLHDEWSITGGVAYDLSRHMHQDVIAREWPQQELLHSQSALAKRIRSHIHRMMPIPAKVVCPSRYLCGLAEGCPHFSSASVEYVPYGVRTLDAPESLMPRSAARKVFDIEQNAKVILLAATNLDSPYKGAHLAIGALQRIDSSVILLLAGHNAEALARCVPQRVIAPGFLHGDRDLLAAYRAANVVLVPSVADNLPYVALDALATQRPVAAFRVGGLVDIVGSDERGLLAEPFLVEQLAANVQRILADKQLAKNMGERGLEWARNHCNMGQFFRAHAAIYAQAAKRATARSQEPPYVV